MDLTERLAAARGLLDAAGDRLPAAGREDLADALGRAEGRLSVTGDATVVAIAGPTGMGKSSLTNTLLDTDIARVGVTRPTTAEPTAFAIGTAPTADLLAHVGLQRAELLAADGRAGLEGLLLVDLPDHDSVVAAHRARAAELVATADRLLWVVDPEKYADASVHDDLLVPLRAHAGVLTVVVNRIDRVAASDREHLLGHLRDLLRTRGMGAVAVIGTSTVDGTGIDAVRALLRASVADHQAAAARATADLRGLAMDLEDHVPFLPTDSRATRRAASGVEDDLVDAALTAAGVDAVLDAVAATHRHRGTRRTGWPPLRRLAARGRTPLARLGLGRTRDRGPTGTRSSRALPQGVATATLGTAIRRQTDLITTSWPPAWRDPLEVLLDDVALGLPAVLDRAVAGTDLDDQHEPRWWAAVGTLQWLLLLTTFAGLAWRGAELVVSWIGLPSLPTAVIAESQLTWPTALLVGGAVLGLVLALLTRPLVRIGGRRAQRRVATRLRVAVTATVEAQLIAPLAQARDDAATARGHLATMRAR